MRWVIILLLYTVRGELVTLSRLHKLHMQFRDRMYLMTHPVNASSLRSDQLKDIANEEWRKLTDMCPSLQRNISIDINFDNSLEDTGTLAWNTHMMKLNNGTLTSTRKDMTIGVNPNPTNGWFYGENCSDISYRYDLRSVIRHEFLHGLGFAASIYKENNLWSVGHSVWGSCYPTQFDTHIVDIDGNNLVEKCTLTGNIQEKQVFINGVKLFNPGYYHGSAFSHHSYDGGLMYWRLSPMRCMPIKEHELKMLSALGVQCLSTESDQQSVALLLVPLVLSLFLPLL